MEWLYYLLEANLYLLLFYGFYRLFLQNETFYNSNRYFLLLTSVSAFILPIMQLGLLKPAPIVDNALFPPPVVYTEEQFAKLALTSVQQTFSLTEWLYAFYLIIALGFAINLGISLFKIIRLGLKAKKAKTGKITLIELQGQKTAFSFFNLLFIHPHLAEKQTVLNHEMVHIKQKHSLDILFFELLQIVCWFNPILYFIKKDIKLLHEYIADELSTNSGIQKHEYAMFLIENSFGVVPTSLTNQIFNQSILKRRINMLNKKRTADWARLRLLLTVPLVGAMLCTSTMAFTKDYGYVDLLPEKSKATAPVQQEVPQQKEKQHTAPKAKTIKRDKVKFPPP
ncbi:MAG: M56 family metallopeptidase, partial [Pedobacter sp.]